MAMTTFATEETKGLDEYRLGHASAATDPLTETAERRPPWPPSDLADVLIDEFGSGDELIVTVGPDDALVVHLHTHTLRARGASAVQGKLERNGSVLAVADVAVVGYDLIGERRVQGRVSIGISYQRTPDGTFENVAGTACARGNWTCGPVRFRIADGTDVGSTPTADSTCGALHIVPAWAGPTPTEGGAGLPSGSTVRRLTRAWFGR